MQCICSHCKAEQRVDDELHYQFVACAQCGRTFQALRETTLELITSYIQDVLNDTIPGIEMVSRQAYEHARLEALRQFEILDTEPEEEFDDIVNLASLACGAPMAAISLVDDHRQWFKARIGFETRETPRSIAFCATAVDSCSSLTVEDTLEDPRFRENPLVTGYPHIRFYAGVPLEADNKTMLGTVCVLDRTSRKLSDEQQGALETIARITMRLLEGRRNARHLAMVLRRAPGRIGA